MHPSQRRVVLRTMLSTLALAGTTSACAIQASAVPYAFDDCGANVDGSINFADIYPFVRASLAGALCPY